MASPNIVEVTDGNFDKEILKAAQPALVDFWATWCAPCRAIAPHIDALAAQYAGQIRVGKCDIDSNQGVPSQFDVRAIPTLLMFKGGQVVGQIVGAAPKNKIEDMIKKALGIG